VKSGSLPRLSTFNLRLSTIRLLFDHPSVAAPILISTRTIHNPKKHQNSDRLLAFRFVASEKPIASRAMNQKVKMSKELASDIRGFDVSGPRKNPALLGTGLRALKCSGSPKRIIASAISELRTFTRPA